MNIISPGNFSPTAIEVKTLREQTGMGLYEAQRQLVLSKMRDRLDHRCNNATLREMLRILISMMMLKQ